MTKDPNTFSVGIILMKKLEVISPDSKSLVTCPDTYPSPSPIPHSAGQYLCSFQGYLCKKSTRSKIVKSSLTNRYSLCRSEYSRNKPFICSEYREFGWGVFQQVLVYLVNVFLRTSSKSNGTLYIIKQQLFQITIIKPKQFNQERQKNQTHL